MTVLIGCELLILDLRIGTVAMRSWLVDGMRCGQWCWIYDTHGEKCDTVYIYSIANSIPMNKREQGVSDSAHKDQNSSR